MNISNELALFFENVLKNFSGVELIGKNCSNNPKIYNKQIQELNEIFGGIYKEKISKDIIETKKYDLRNISYKITLHQDPLPLPYAYLTTDSNEITKMLKKLYTQPNLLKIYLNKRSYYELEHQFVYQHSYNRSPSKLINIIIKEFCPFSGHTPELQSNNDDEILEFYSNMLQKCIIVYNDTYNYHMYDNDNKYRPIVLFKHENGLYNSLSSGGYTDSQGKRTIDYYLEQKAPPTKKQKIQEFINFKKLLHYFYPEQYNTLINNIIIIIFNEIELEWIDYAIVEAIYHRFNPLYQIYTHYN
jgi:hypothetical protein